MTSTLAPAPDDLTLYVSALDASTNGIVVFDAVRNGVEQTVVDFRVRLMNRVAEEAAGQSRHVLIGRTFSEVYPSGPRHEVLEAMLAVFNTGRAQRVERHNAEADTWSSVSIVPLNDGLVMTFVDITPIKRLEQQVTRQAEQLRTVLDGSVACITALAALRSTDGQLEDFIYTAVNRAAEQLEGLPASQMLGRRITQLFPGVVTQGLYTKYVAVLESGQPQRFEFYYDADDFRGWLDMSVVKQDDGLILTYLDITQSKQNHEIQRATAESLQSVLDSAPSGVFLMDAIRDETGQIIDFEIALSNQTAADLTHHALNELICCPTSELFPYYKEAGFFDAYANVVETGETLQTHQSYYADGVAGWFDVTVVKRGDGIVLSFLDITPLKKTEDDHRRQAELLRSVLDGSQNAIVCFDAVRDATGRIVDFRYAVQNEANRRERSDPDNQLIGQLLRSSMPNSVDEVLMKRYADVVETSQPCRFIHAFNEGGLRGWFDVSVVKRGDGVVVTRMDVTEQTQAQQERETLVRDLQRSNENLEQFAYVASHDLQEPLRKIQAFGGILRDQYAPVLGESGADIVSRMETAADRMATLIRDLLTYSRLTTQRQVFVPIDVQRTVQDVLADLDDVVKRTDAQIDVQPLPTLIGDALQLRQLVQNLISNALKFTKPGQPPHLTISGRIALGAELRAQETTGPESIQTGALLPRQRYAVIQIDDRGIGFDEQYVERIFQAFQRLHGRGQYVGTGIGLAIVKKVVENHAGAIAVRSRPNEGATFTIVLPAL